MATRTGLPLLILLQLFLNLRLSHAEYSINYDDGDLGNYYGNNYYSGDGYSSKYDYDAYDSYSSKAEQNRGLAELEQLLYNAVAKIGGSSNIGAMSGAARILTGTSPKSGYHQQQQQVMMYAPPAPAQYHQPTGYQQPQQSYQPQVVPAKPSGYQQQQHQPAGYGYSQMSSGYGHQSSENSYKPMMSYKPKRRRKKEKVKKVYVPIVIRKKKQKKRKIIAVYKGFYIQGGTQIFGKFKKIKDCQKACEITPNCFAADYNPWLKKCYIHTNVSACEEMRTHPKLIHFKKVPCDLLETPRGLITLGVRIHGGLEQKGVKNLQDCIKKCATAGQGIAPDSMTINIAKQICFGIDYDFATHKCYFHTDPLLCPAVDPIPTPVQVVTAPSVINILLCPLTSITA